MKKSTPTNTGYCSKKRAGRVAKPMSISSKGLTALVVIGCTLLHACKKSASSRNEPEFDSTDTAKHPLKPLANSVSQNPEAAQSAPGATSKQFFDEQLDGPESFRSFNFEAPAERTLGARELKIWATYYYIPKVNSSPGNEIVLRDSLEKNLLEDERISKKDWCDLALQGSGRIFKSTGEKLTISFSGRSQLSPIFCNGYIGVASVIEKVKGNRFAKVESIFGRGARVQEVIPYRTIAVDPNVIDYGSVVYIPEARGKQISFESGAQAIHDGYFFAGDTGSAIIGNHIDVFTGTVKKQPFDFVKSTSAGTFKAYVIKNDAIRNSLAAMHRYSN